MENLFKVIDEAIRQRNYYIDSLREERDKVFAENRELKKRIEELETKINSEVMEAIK